MIEHAGKGVVTHETHEGRIGTVRNKVRIDQ